MKFFTAAVFTLMISTLFNPSHAEASYSKSLRKDSSEGSTNSKVTSSRRGYDQNGRRIRVSPTSAYKNHKANMAKSVFSTSSTSSRSNSASSGAGNAYYQTRVLSSSSSPQSNLLPRRRQGRSSSSVARPKVLNETDYKFLGDLSRNLNNDTVSKRLNAIVSDQRAGKYLSKRDYEFITDLSKKINHEQVSYQLYEISQKRRKPLY